jgi:hypothetical protein
MTQKRLATVIGAEPTSARTSSSGEAPPPGQLHTAGNRDLVVRFDQVQRIGLDAPACLLPERDHLTGHLRLERRAEHAGRVDAPFARHKREAQRAAITVEAAG